MRGEWVRKDDPRLPENEIFQGKAAKQADKKLKFSNSKFESIAKKRMAAAEKLDKAMAGTSKSKPHAREEERKITEARRLREMLRHEYAIVAERREELKKEGCTDIEAEMSKFVVIGIDEVGVGPLAGPIVSCAVAWEIPTEEQLFGQLLFEGLNDSKKLKPAQREELDVKLRKYAKAFHIAEVTAQEVAIYNPREGSMLAMERAVQGVLEKPALKDHRAHLLIDYHSLPWLVDTKTIIGQISMPKGDELSQSIAAASVIAKVYRDKYMTELGKKYPHFGFEKNAGYGTQAHRDMLKKGYLCPEHRISFAPVAEANLIAMQACKEADAKGLPAPFECWWPVEEEEGSEDEDSDDVVQEAMDKAGAKGKKGKGRAAPKGKGKAAANKGKGKARSTTSTAASRKRKSLAAADAEDAGGEQDSAPAPAAKKSRAKRTSLPLEERDLPNDASADTASNDNSQAPKPTMLTRLSSWLMRSSTST